VEAAVELPPETTGVFVWGGRETELKPGMQTLRL